MLDQAAASGRKIVGSLMIPPFGVAQPMTKLPTPAVRPRGALAGLVIAPLVTSAVQQIAFFPRKALNEFPPKEKSADSLGEAEADDNFRYYIKGDAHGRRVRASEWISTHIAEEVGIAAPAATVIERQDNTTVFGSRRISGVADATTTVAYLTAASLSNTAQNVVGLRPILSSIYALDMFLYNDDRHLNNYLSIDDNGVRRLYAFDFSRALFWSWPWNGFPQGCNTRLWGNVLRQLHGFDAAAAGATMDRLTALAPATVEGFINRMPTDWLPDDLRSQFIQWWSSTAREVRLNELRKGIADGSLL